MERKEGRFTYNGTAYDVIDLPGSYSLSAGSDEEKITADYIRSGRADLVAILVDSSQLERLLYMYTDFYRNKHSGRPRAEPDGCGLYGKNFRRV